MQLETSRSSGLRSITQDCSKRFTLETTLLWKGSLELNQIFAGMPTTVFCFPFSEACHGLNSVSGYYVFPLYDMFEDGDL